MEPKAPAQQESSIPSSMETAEDLASKLNIALRNSNRKAVLELLEKGADVNSKAEYGWTPLQSAVQAGDEDLVRLLLDKGACPHARKDNGGTAFTEAAMVGKVTILELLLDQGLNIDDHDDNGFTAFMEAAWYGNEEALRFLFRRGANVNLRREVNEEKARLHKGGETALMDASKRGHLSVVKALVQEMGADVNICDNKDRNALIHALKEGCAQSAVPIGHFLLDHGANVKSKDECGKTALILAVEMKSLDLVEALLKKGDIDIDDADEEGNTALMAAVEKNAYEIAKVLCEKGARTDVGNLIAVANRNRAHEMGRLLRRHNASFAPDTLPDWQPSSARWNQQLKHLHSTYRPMVGKLKTFPYIKQRILNTSQGGIYLGLYGGAEVAVRMRHGEAAKEEKRFLESCGGCKHLLKLFQFEKHKDDMYLCFPLWERSLEEGLQEPADQKGHKDTLRMIFQAVAELHSLGFAHRDLHPRNFLIDLDGKIYLADFDNSRKLIDGQEDLINSDLEALGQLVLYVLTGGRKPLEQVSTEDLAPDSPDYEEALDLVRSLVCPDERGLEGLSNHPYFWNKQSLDFLKRVWNKIKILPNRRAVSQALNATEHVPYPQWTTQIDQGVLNDMKHPPRAKPIQYSNSIIDLLKFIRNLDEHANNKITKITGDHAEYFLKLFPALTMYIYNSLRQHPSCRRWTEP